MGELEEPLKARDMSAHSARNVSVMSLKRVKYGLGVGANEKETEH